MNNVYQLAIRKGPQPGQIFPLFSPLPSSDAIPSATSRLMIRKSLANTHASPKPVTATKLKTWEAQTAPLSTAFRLAPAPVQLAHGNEIQFGSGVNMIFELAPDEVEAEMGLRNGRFPPALSKKSNPTP